MLCKVLRRGSGGARLEAVLVRGGSGYFLAAVAPMVWSTLTPKWLCRDGSLIPILVAPLFFKLQATWLRGVTGAAGSRH